MPFLKKLNQSFFCLSAQGLKSFRCDVRMDLADWLSQKQLAEKDDASFLYAITKTQVKISDDADGKIMVGVTPPATSTGVPDWDERLSKLV
jgi:hypothetical protein